MSAFRTHREIIDPQITARYLADYMAASERAQRTIVRNCRYQPIARVVQHNEAKAAVSGFIWRGDSDTTLLSENATQLRNRLADTDFDRDLYDHNADYIDRFAEVFPTIDFPNADLLPPGDFPSIELRGTRVTTEIHFRLRRLTRTNRIRVGVAMLRYSKGKPLPPAIAEWQSAFMFGYLRFIGVEDGAEPEHRLCITLDAYSGVCHPAPTDSVRRFSNMEAACASIYERWPNIEPPQNAVL